jgi:hypothetical protein
MTRIRSAAGIDTDGVAETEAGHFALCLGCNEWFDMRDLAKVFNHLHGAKIEIKQGAGPPLRPSTEPPARPPRLRVSTSGLSSGRQCGSVSSGQQGAVSFCQGSGRD